MKIPAIILIVLALVIGIVPYFTDCESQGNSITLANGNEIPMKCHWTGVAEAVLAVPLLGVGGLMFAGKRRETRRALGVVGALIGLFVVLLPTTLIGVCPGEDMLCNMIMRPTLVLGGILVVAASLFSLTAGNALEDEA